MSENIISKKSFDLAVRTVNLYKHLTAEKKEFVLSKQLLRSGTSIGANVSEAERGQSKADFNAKLNIRLRLKSSSKSSTLPKNISHSASSTSSGIASLGNTTAFSGFSQKFSVAEIQIEITL